MADDPKSKELWEKYRGASELQANAESKLRRSMEANEPFWPQPGVLGDERALEDEVAAQSAMAAESRATADLYDQGVRKERGVYAPYEEKPPAIIGPTQSATDPLTAAPDALQPTKREETGIAYPPGYEEQRAQLQDELLAVEKEVAGRRGQAATYAINAAKDASLKRQAAEYLAEGGEEYARQHMQRLANAYDEAELNIASLRVDPQRWEQDTPALAQVLMAIASSAFSFFSGGQGPNPVVALIDRAIDRDMKAQMVNAENQLKAAGMGIEKEQVLGQLGTAMHSAMYERALNTMEAILKEGGAMSSAEEHAAALQGLVANAIKARIAAYDAHAVKYKNTYDQPGGGGGVKITYTDAEKYAQKVGAMREGTRLVGELAQVVKDGAQDNPITRSKAWNYLTSIFEDGYDKDGKPVKLSSGDIAAQVESFATRLARATGSDVGNFAVQETDRFIRAVRGQQWNSAQIELQNIFSKIEANRKEQRALMSGLGNPTALKPLDDLAEESFQKMMTAVGLQRRAEKRGGK